MVGLFLSVLLSRTCISACEKDYRSDLCDRPFAEGLSVREVLRVDDIYVLMIFMYCACCQEFSDEGKERGEKKSVLQLDEHFAILNYKNYDVRRFSRMD